MKDEEINKLNLFEKMQLVSNEVRNIEKDMQVGNGSYAYKAVSDLAVILAVKDAETKYRIISVPTKEEVLHNEVVKSVNSSGREMLNYSIIIKKTLEIINLDNTTEKITIESHGHGLDSSDKGTGKASTYARKYALLNAYKIATGEDPDSSKSESSFAQSIDEKKIAIINYANSTPEYNASLVTHFNVISLSDLDKSQIEVVYNDLHKKGRL